MLESEDESFESLNNEEAALFKGILAGTDDNILKAWTREVLAEIHYKEFYVKFEKKKKKKFGTKLFSSKQ